MLSVGGGVGDALVDGVLHVDETGKVVIECGTVGVYIEFVARVSDRDGRERKVGIVSFI